VTLSLALVVFVACTLAIWVGGRTLTRSADIIAAHTGLGRVFIGSFLLAATTSLPEVATGAAAASLGLVDIALGSLFGSNIFNMTIIAVSGIVWGGGSLLAAASKAHVITATFGMLLSAIAALNILTRPTFGVLGIGVGVWVIVGVYALGLRLLKGNSAGDEAGSDGAEATLLDATFGVTTAWVRYLAAAALVITAAFFLSMSADVIATATGLGGTFIGTTLVAATTSMPEVVTTIAAVRLGAVDLAVGNVLGSNIFNMTILLVADIFYRGGHILSVGSATHAITALVGLVLSGLVVLMLVAPTTRRLGRLSAEAAILFAAYLIGSFLVFLYRHQ
jgi:cation:H+ antiporter